MTVDREGQGATPTEPRRPSHIPVLLSEVIQSLGPGDGHTFIDATFGAGGYTKAILNAADCRVLAIDRDPSAAIRASELATQFPGRLTFKSGRFGELDEIARAAGHGLVEGVVLDIGVSSMQLESPERGFSFQVDGPLDMRMSSDGLTAADVVNTAEESSLADILFTLGEEHRSRGIAKAIVKARQERPIATTRELAALVARVLGGRKPDGHHPATKTFQALRILVNDELGELARGLSAAERILSAGGRLVVVSFHSLEDRIVKRFLAKRAGKESRGSRHLPERSIKVSPPSFRLVNPRPLTPSKGELDVNPRARSARLRAAVRTDAAAWPFDASEFGVDAEAP